MLIPRLQSPSTSPEPCIDLEQAGIWLRQDTGATGESELITASMIAAMESLETLCKQPLFERAYYGYGIDFSDTQLHSLNVSAVSAVEYETSGGEWTALDAADYWFFETGEIFFSDTARAIKSIRRIRVSYTAGFPKDSVPQNIIMAVRFLIARWYDKRADEKKEVPSSAEYLVQGYTLPLL